MLKDELFGLVETLARQQMLLLFSILFSLAELTLIGGQLVLVGFQLQDFSQGFFELLVRDLVPLDFLVILVHLFLLLFLIVEAQGELLSDCLLLGISL